MEMITFMGKSINTIYPLTSTISTSFPISSKTMKKKPKALSRVSRLAKKSPTRVTRQSLSF
jgi:hypothetical protein